jgi:hypothetical protein
MFAWNAFILTKQTITSSYTVTEKFRKVNFPSHDRVCNDRIRHLNHLRSLIVLSTKVSNLPFWIFEFSQVRRCHMAPSKWPFHFKYFIDKSIGLDNRLCLYKSSPTTRWNNLNTIYIRHRAIYPSCIHAIHLNYQA